MLHITDGESVAGSLRKSGLPGEVAAYFDALSEGPVPDGLSAEDFRQLRAKYFDYPDYAEYLASGDRALSSYPSHNEVVLWLDYRLSDQLLLIKALDWFSRQDLGGTRLSLICLGHYPGFDRFIGLGQLRPDQLAPLVHTRLAVSDAQFRKSKEAWRAFTSTDPSAIERLIEGDTSSLPFLSAALQRYFEEFPSLDTGLSRTERKALSVLREFGPRSPIQLFVSVRDSEEQVFMGDLSFYRVLRGLILSRHPLICPVEMEHANDADWLMSEEWANSPMAITDAGVQVLAGSSDHIRLNGIDRWLGGVHLKDSEAVWRWDSQRRRLKFQPTY